MTYTAQDDDLRAVRFTFGDSQASSYPGYTDDTRWNGWLNVWIGPEVWRKQIRPDWWRECDTCEGRNVSDGWCYTCGRRVIDLEVLEYIEELDAEAAAAEAGERLMGLDRCWTTSEVG